jgi:hypothetical protein
VFVVVVAVSVEGVEYAVSPLVPIEPELEVSLYVESVDIAVPVDAASVVPPVVPVIAVSVVDVVPVIAVSVVVPVVVCAESVAAVIAVASARIVIASFIFIIRPSHAT